MMLRSSGSFEAFFLPSAKARVGLPERVYQPAMGDAARYVTEVAMFVSFAGALGKTLKNFRHQTTLLLGTGIVLLTAVILSLMGQPLWCRCGSWTPWSWDIWSAHNSQHIIDPYTFTHVLHGVLLCGILYWLPRSLSERVRLLAAVVLESCWEILENSPIIIERYRAATISKDYFGDSVANSVADIVACVIGYQLAYRLRTVKSLAFFAATEVILLFMMRDCLILNIVMLVCPLDVVRQWQLGK